MKREALNFMFMTFVVNVLLLIASKLFEDGDEDYSSVLDKAEILLFVLDEEVSELKGNHG